MKNNTLHQKHKIRYSRRQKHKPRNNKTKNRLTRRITGGGLLGRMFISGDKRKPIRDLQENSTVNKPTEQQTDSLLSEFTILRKPTDTITPVEFERLDNWDIRKGIDSITSLQQRDLETALEYAIDYKKRAYKARIDDEEYLQTAAARQGQRSRTPVDMGYGRDGIPLSEYSPPWW